MSPDGRGAVLAEPIYSYKRAAGVSTLRVHYLLFMEDGDHETRRALGRAVDRAATIADELQRQARRADLTSDDWLIALGRLGTDLAELRRSVNGVSPALGLPSGAHDRILRYLRLRIGEVVDKDELEGVAGISEWARRVRELREDDGWQISTYSNRGDLRPGEYVLESTVPDPALAARWRTARTIQRHQGSSKDRVLEYMRSCLGRAVLIDEIAYVARHGDHSAVLNELREEGWQITSSVDDDTLGPDEYMLVSDVRRGRS